MSIQPTQIGSLPLGRLHSVSYEPGKWSCTVVRDGFQGLFNENEVKLPDVSQFGWVLVRSELQDEGEGESVRYDTYESGSSIISGGGDDRGAAAQETWGMSVTLNLQPISMHKKMSYLKNTYKGRLQDGEWIWPEYDPTGTSSRSGTDKSGNTIYGVNPMYGVQEFLSPTCTLTRTKVVQGAYLSLGAGLGNVEDPPSSAPLQLPSGTGGSGAAEYRYWLKTADTVSMHGADHEITESWDFAPNGWNTFIYSPKSKA